MSDTLTKSSVALSASGESSTNSYSPLYQLRVTLLGNTNELEQILPITPRFDVETTYNRKYGFMPQQLPPTITDKTSGATYTLHPKLQYFTVGIGGKRNVDGTNITETVGVKNTNEALYTDLPIRCVPAETGLSADARANLRGRQIRVYNGNSYEVWQAKVMTVSDSKVQYTQLDPATDEQVEYTLDPSDLSPTPPDATTNGQTTNIDAEVSAQVATAFTLTGAEVTEVVGVIYSGDMRYASISEIGVMSGSDVTNNTTDFNGNSLTYTEAAMMQLNIHYTFNGQDMSAPTALFNQNFLFVAGNMILA